MSKKRSPIWHYFVPGTEDSSTIIIISNYIKKINFQNSMNISICYRYRPRFQIQCISVKSSIGATLIAALAVLTFTNQECCTRWYFHQFSLSSTTWFSCITLSCSLSSYAISALLILLLPSLSSSFFLSHGFPLPPLSISPAFQFSLSSYS